MAIQNSTTQIVLPGFETSLTNVVTPIVNTTNTAVAAGRAENLASFATLSASSLQAKSVANPSAGGLYNNENTPSTLPTFGTWQWWWADDSNNAAGVTVMDSDMNQISSYKPGIPHSDTGDVNQATGWTLRGKGRNEIGTGDQDAGRFGGSQGQAWWTQSSFDSGNTSYFNMSTGSSSQWGSGYFRFPTFNAVGAQFFRAPDQFWDTFRDCGIVIGKEGVRAKYAFWNRNNDLRTFVRGIGESSGGYIDRIDTISSTTYSTWGSKGNSFGMNCYNDRTRTFVLIEGDNSNNMRAHVWRNATAGRSLMSDQGPGKLHQFFSEAKAGGSSGTTTSYKYYDFTWQSGGSTSYTESRHAMRIIMGDNGMIGLSRMTPQSNGQTYAVFNAPAATPAAADSSAQILTTHEGVAYVQMGNTTSYGRDNGASFGLKHNINWANSIVNTYSPYYYWGSGTKQYFIDVYDPRRTLRYEENQTAFGTQTLPIGEKDFVFRNSAHNTDSAVGFRLSYVPMGKMLENMRNQNGATIAMNASIDTQLTGSNGYMFDSTYNSTQYGSIHPLDKWVSL